MYSIGNWTELVTQCSEYSIWNCICELRTLSYALWLKLFTSSSRSLFFCCCVIDTIMTHWKVCIHLRTDAMPSSRVMRDESIDCIISVNSCASKSTTKHTQTTNQWLTNIFARRTKIIITHIEIPTMHPSFINIIIIGSYEEARDDYALFNIYKKKKIMPEEWMKRA